MLSPLAYRNETPGISLKTHFNNAGASLMPFPVTAEIKRYLDLESEIGGYEAADVEGEQLDLFYHSFASLINTRPENIAYTSSATNSFARALSSIPFSNNDVIIIAREDYISNQFAFLSLQQRYNVKLIRALSKPDGGVDVDDVERLFRLHSPRLLSLSHVPSNSGLIQPAEQIGALCEKYDVLYLLDACQSVGQMPVDVENIKCDFLCATMRKFLRGPRGAGFLYVSDKALQMNLTPLFIDLRGAMWTEEDVFKLKEDAKRYEDSEVPYALQQGARVAADYAMSVGLHNIAERNSYLCEQIRNGLQDMGFELLDRGSKLSSIITIKVDGVNSTTLLRELRARNINVSISQKNFALPDFNSKKVDWALRVSPHYYNNEDEVALLLEAMAAYKQ